MKKQGDDVNVRFIRYNPDTTSVSKLEVLKNENKNTNFESVFSFRYLFYDMNDGIPDILNDDESSDFFKNYVEI